MMALLNSLVTKGGWFARKYFVLIGACLFNTIKKMFLKNSIFFFHAEYVTLSRRRPLSYRNHSIDLLEQINELVSI